MCCAFSKKAFFHQIWSVFSYQNRVIRYSMSIQGSLFWYIGSMQHQSRIFNPQKRGFPVDHERNELKEPHFYSLPRPFCPPGPLRPSSPVGLLPQHNRAAPALVRNGPGGAESRLSQLSSLNSQLFLKVVAVAHASVHRVGPVTEISIAIDKHRSLRSHRHAQPGSDLEGRWERRERCSSTAMLTSVTEPTR